MKLVTQVIVALALCSQITSAKEEKMNQDTKLLIDFSKDTKGMQIGVTNDGVMGGLSQGKIEKTDQGTFLFSGKLSLENNGGFSSLRMTGKQWDLGDWKGVELTVKGDGRAYGFRATTDERYRWSRVSFTNDFQTQKDEWVTVRVPFSAMKASWRGRKLNNTFDASKISGLGIILADKIEGPFTLEIKSISAWK